MVATALAMPPSPQNDLDAYLAANSEKSMLRFLTCGSVDDGKSTLIGRLLFDSHALFDDQLATLATDSRRSGTPGDALDLALLVDGLAAEREQGITIDVAYRFFATNVRKFIVADTPGHEQYTRNMVTGASTSDLAVLLVDASKGVLTQTRRHATLVHLLGLPHVVLAVNKMDLVGYDRDRFDAIVGDFRAFARGIGMADATAIPVSGLTGDNVTVRSDAMPWYRGPSLLRHLETVPVATTAVAPFRVAVQSANRPHADFRGYAGTVSGGTVRPGDAVVILPSGARTRVDRIVTFDGDRKVATAGQAVTLTLTDDVDCSRGDVLAAADDPPAIARSLDASLVWMVSDRLVTGRAYLLKIGTRTVSATVAAVDARIDVDTGTRTAGATGLGLNEIGECRIDLDRAIVADLYANDRRLGGFILIDKVTHATVAAGMIRALGTSAMPAPPANADRILWVVAPDLAARSALARNVRKRLEALGRPVVVLDAATLRDGLNSDLAAPKEHLRRVREVARLIERAGVHVIVDVDVRAEQAYPGRRIGPADEASGTEDWMI